MRRPDRSLHQRTARPSHHPPHRLRTTRLPRQRRREEAQPRQKFQDYQVRRKSQDCYRAEIPQVLGKTRQQSQQKRSHVLLVASRACENMLANCINQYLNTDYEAKKAGEITDLVDIFIFYYHHINARAKAAQLTVIKNCQLFTETNFIQENIAFFL